MLPDNVRDKIQFEFQSIEKELAAVSTLFDDLSSREPDFIQLRAIASSLHAFYNGVERILMVIIKSIDGEVPEGERWHSELLNNTIQANPLRARIISDEMKLKLEQYLAFRHYFRHSYGFTLEWDLMRSLWLDLRTVYQGFLSEINAFLEKK